RRGRSEPARPDEEDLRAQQLALSLLADLREEEVPAVALDLIGRQGHVLDDGQSRLCPLLIAALEVDDVGVPEILERLGGQDRAPPGLAVEDDGRRGIRDDAPDAELEKAATDIGRGLDVAVAILVRVAHVDDADRLARSDASLEFGGALLGYDRSGLGNHLFEGSHRLNGAPLVEPRRSDRRGIMIRHIPDRVNSLYR